MQISRMYSSRREMDVYAFHPTVTLLVPLAAVFLGAYLPKIFPWLAILDFPLIIVIFFGVARRNPIAGTFTGALVGCLQDLLSNQPIGINGMVKAVIGYMAASVGLKIDVEVLATRVLLNFGFSLLQSLMLYLVYRGMLGVTMDRSIWLHELLRAFVNTAIAIPLFLLLDRTRQST